MLLLLFLEICRTLYRYVDWNPAALRRTLQSLVVPYIGTWIETKSTLKALPSSSVVPYIGTWIETKRGTTTREIGSCRTLYRYVDWNILVWIGNIIGMVVPYIGTWIETDGTWPWAFGLIVVPYIGTWIETDKILGQIHFDCRTLYRYVDWNVFSQSRTVFENCRTLYRYVDWNNQRTTNCL